MRSFVDHVCLCPLVTSPVATFAQLLLWCWYL